MIILKKIFLFNFIKAHQVLVILAFPLILSFCKPCNPPDKSDKEAVRKFCKVPSCAQKNPYFCRDNFYFGYKPVIVSEHDNALGYDVMKFYVQLCTIAEDLDNIPDDNFLRYSNQDMKGFFFYKDKNPGLPNEKIEVPSWAEFVNAGDYKRNISNKSNLKLYKSAQEILGLRDAGDGVPHPAYSSFLTYAENYENSQNQDVPNYAGNHCNVDFYCIPKPMIDNLLQCGGSPNNLTATISCPRPLMGYSTFKTDKLPDQSSEYGNDIIYPTLKHPKNTQPYATAHFFFDSQKDVPYVIKGSDSKNSVVGRRMFVNVILKPGSQDLNGKYRLSLTLNGGDPKNKLHDQFVNLDGTSHPKVRYCGSDTKGKKYVVEFIMPAAGTYDLTLYNTANFVTPNCKGKDDYECVSSLQVVVSPVDEYQNESLPEPLSSGTREMKLTALDLGLSSIPSIADCHIKSKSNLSETLKDAFSINQKVDLREKIASQDLRPGISFKIEKHRASSPYFDQNGNLKLRIEFIIDDLNRYPKLSLSAVYQIELARVYRLIYDAVNAGGFSKDDPTRAYAFYANRFVLSNDRWKVLPTVSGEEGEEAIGFPSASSPNKELAPIILGSTGPAQGSDIRSLLTVAGVFKAGQTSVDPAATVSYESRAAITLVHELGHVWSHNLMAHDNAKTAEELHSHYCTGYNAESCVFKYKDVKQHYASNVVYDEFGVVWCEGHKNIILNQLFRKY